MDLKSNSASGTESSLIQVEQLLYFSLVKLLSNSHKPTQTCKLMFVLAAYIYIYI